MSYQQWLASRPTLQSIAHADNGYIVSQAILSNIPGLIEAARDGVGWLIDKHEEPGCQLIMQPATKDSLIL
jgi:hypothetical protein